MQSSPLNSFIFMDATVHGTPFIPLLKTIWFVCLFRYWRGRRELNFSIFHQDFSLSTLVWKWECLCESRSNKWVVKTISIFHSASFAKFIPFLIINNNSHSNLPNSSKYILGFIYLSRTHWRAISHWGLFSTCFVLSLRDSCY